MKKIQKNAARFDNKHVQLLPMSEALASGLKKYRLGHLYRSLAVNFSEPTPL